MARRFYDEIRRSEYIRLQIDALPVQHRLEGGERGFQPLRHRQSVCAILAFDDDHNGGLGHDRGRAHGGRRGIGHGRHVTERDTNSVFPDQQCSGQFGGGLDLAFRADRDALVRILDEPGAAHRRRSPGRRDYIADRKIVAHELGGIDLDLELPGLATEDDGVGYPAHFQQLRPYRPLCDIVQFHQ